MKDIPPRFTEPVLLNEGGMGKVYKAFDTSLHRHIALKEIRTSFFSDLNFQQFIQRESRTLKELDHPNIIHYFDFIRQENQFFILMELIEGKDLEQHIASRNLLPYQEALNIFIKILKALDYIHSKGIIHRDIKPANILISSKGDVKLIDFGIIKQAIKCEPSEANLRVGTERYMSPEQKKGIEIDHRSDIYSLGVMLFKMVTGRFPADEKDNPRDYYPYIPEFIVNAIHKAIQVSMSLRYGTVQEFLNDLILGSKAIHSEETDLSVIEESLSAQFISSSVAQFMQPEELKEMQKKYGSFKLNYNGKRYTTPLSEEQKRIIALIKNYILRGNPTLASLEVENFLVKSYGNKLGLSQHNSEKIEFSLPQIHLVPLRRILENTFEKSSSDSQEISDLKDIVRMPLEVARYQRAFLFLLEHQVINQDETIWYFDLENFDPVFYLSLYDFICLYENIYNLIYGRKKGIKAKLKIPESDLYNLKNSFLYKYCIECVDYYKQEAGSLPNLLNAIKIYRGSHPGKNLTGNVLFITNASKQVKEKVQSATPLDYQIDDEKTNILKYFLRNIFRKSEFREGQVEIIKRALSRKNTVGLLPTGAGKSLCYQLVSFLQPGAVIIVDPIKSLMLDQNLNINKYLIDRSRYISSDNSQAENKKAEKDFESGFIQMLFITPERLQIQSFRDLLQFFCQSGLISYAVIDEAHCISEWGHDFRISYLSLARSVRKYCNHNGIIPAFYALTGTASEAVLRDIQRELEILEDSEAVIRSRTFDRDELQFRVKKCRSDEKFQKLKEAFGEMAQNNAVGVNHLFNVSAEPIIPGIIFVPHVNSTDYSVAKLNSRIGENFNLVQTAVQPDSKVTLSPKCPNCDSEMRLRTNSKNGSKFWGCSRFPRCKGTWDYSESQGYSQGTGYLVKHFQGMMMYSGTAPKFFSESEWTDYKIQAQEKFIGNKVPLLISTKSFGMGIDKPNIRYTIHYNLPPSIESFYQEAGRAGRDRKPAYCYVIFSDDNYEDSDRRLDPSRSADEIWALSEPFVEGDVHRNLFFQKNSFEGRNKEIANAKQLLDYLNEHLKNIKTYEKKIVSIPFRFANMQHDAVEKAIYRLFIIGLVDDYTVHYSEQNFVLSIVKEEKETYVKNLFEYLLLRKDGFLNLYSSFKDYYTRLFGKESSFYNTCYQCLEKLISFIYETIEPQRRRSLYNLVDAVRSPDNKQFRLKVLRYLDPSEELNQMFIIFPNNTNVDDWVKILERGKDQKTLSSLLGICLRMLESFPTNVGLLFLSSALRMVVKNETRRNIESDFNALVQSLNTQNYKDLFKARAYSEFLGFVSDKTDKQKVLDEIVKKIEDEIAKIDDLGSLAIILGQSKNERLMGFTGSKILTAFDKNIKDIINQIWK